MIKSHIYNLGSSEMKDSKKNRENQKNLHFLAPSAMFQEKTMTLSDTEVKQLAGIIADLFEEGKDYAVYETAQMEYDSFGTPVVRRRAFKIRIEEVKWK